MWTKSKKDQARILVAVAVAAWAILACVWWVNGAFSWLYVLSALIVLTIFIPLFAKGKGESPPPSS
jgi:hypothetical protein